MAESEKSPQRNERQSARQGGPPDPDHSKNQPASSRREQGADKSASSDEAKSDQPETEPYSDVRARRNRRRMMLEQLAATFEMEPGSVADLLMMLDELLPDANRMSTSADVSERFESAVKEARRVHPRLLFNRKTNSPLDMTSVKSTFRQNADLAGLFESEEGLLKALIVNERMIGGYTSFVAEHEALRSTILAEYVRRTTLVEQWRHLIPKFMLPVYSMMERAGVRSSDLRLNSALLNQIRNVISAWSQGRVSTSDLAEAAERTEDEFARAMSDSTLDSAADESWSACRERLENLCTRKKHSLAEDGESPEEVTDAFKADELIEKLERAIAAGAGLDSADRIIFPSFDDLSAMIDNVADQKIDIEQSRVVSKSSLMSGSDEAQNKADPQIWNRRSDLPAGPSSAELSSASREKVSTEESGGSKAIADTFEDHDALQRMRSMLAEEPQLPPGDSKAAFDPEQLASLRGGIDELRETSASLPRSTGLSRSTSSDPFVRWKPNFSPPPFCFMAFRYQPDLSAREGTEGRIEPADLARIEIGEGQWSARTENGASPILGESHPIMLPPHSNLSWYGKVLGWESAEAESLNDFGSPARPETVCPNGDPHRLMKAFRSVAALRIKELVEQQKEHLLSHSADGAKRREEAIEDLARYWLFILLARHNQDGFDRIFHHGFFHGVHGPDIAIAHPDDTTVSKNTAEFRGLGQHSFVMLYSRDLLNELRNKQSDKSDRGQALGDLSGVRRLRTI